MPTRPQTWRFRRIYDGFEHGGLRTEIDQRASTPVDRSGRVVRVRGKVRDGDGRPVGEFTRLLASGSGGFRARHEHLELASEARGRGFARALHAASEARYRRMGIEYVTLHAEHVGSLLWPRLGYDFDLRGVPGDTDAVRRAHAVLALLSPAARAVVDRARPTELLERWEAGPEPGRRAAAAALRARLPTPERVAAGDLDGLLLTPAGLGAFASGGFEIGRELMLGASWDAYKPLGPSPVEARRPDQGDAPRSTEARHGRVRP